MYGVHGIRGNPQGTKSPGDTQMVRIGIASKGFKGMIHPLAAQDLRGAHIAACAAAIARSWPATGPASAATSGQPALTWTSANCRIVLWCSACTERGNNEPVADGRRRRPTGWSSRVG